MIDTTNIYDGLILIGIYFLGLFAGKFLWVSYKKENRDDNDGK